MEKELKEIMKEAHRVITEHLCWEAGCKAIFGDPDIVDVKKAILEKGAEEIVKATTWSYNRVGEKSYDEWVKDKVRWDELPEELSKAAYLDGFLHQLTAEYIRQKKEEEEHAQDAQ